MLHSRQMHAGDRLSTEEEAARLAAIPRRLLKDRYLLDKAKRALAAGRCPDCRAVSTVIDTSERECQAVGIGAREGNVVTYEVYALK